MSNGGAVHSLRSRFSCSSSSRKVLVYLANNGRQGSHQTSACPALTGRVVTKSPFTCIVPLLCSLQCLPVKFRRDFKIYLLTYKTILEKQRVYLLTMLAKSINQSINEISIVLISRRNQARRDSKISVQQQNQWSTCCTADDVEPSCPAGSTQVFWFGPNTY